MISIIKRSAAQSIFNVGFKLHTAKSRANNSIDVFKESRYFGNFNSLRSNKSPKHLVQKEKDRRSEPKDSKAVVDFTRIKFKDHIVDELMVNLRSRSYSIKNKLIVLEGRKLILEALKYNLKMNLLIFSRMDQFRKIVDAFSNQMHTEVYKVPHHDLKLWSTLTTPPGLIGVFERPTKNIPALSGTTMPITVVCDNIREPSNMGSVIRTCAAVPCAQLVAMKGCCDPWEQKSLQAGCGGHFALKIWENMEWEHLNSISPNNDLTDYHVIIAENDVTKIHENTRVGIYKDPIGSACHYIVIIGGESLGISQDAYKFLSNAGEKGTCIHIPLANGINSLNLCSALTLLLFELKYQLQQ